jgi:curli biogenesis system outer membrane secretion channel CsgG
MSMTRRNLTSSLLGASVAAVFTKAAQAQTKRRVAIEEFDYSTVYTAVQSIFGTNVDIGKGISAMLTTRVSQGGKFTVVERRKINTVLKEQDFGASNRVKKGTGARIGEVRGADFSLMGDIVVFGRDDRRKSGILGGAGGGVGAVVGGSKSAGKAVVVLAYRLVDNETSEILAAGEARGESKRESKSGFGGFFAGGALVGGGFSDRASNFGETIIGEAVMDAVDKLAVDFENAASGAANSQKEVEIEAMVADVAGGAMTINAGSAAGIQAGQKLTVYRKGKEIKDPQTGEVLDTQVDQIGTLTITTVRERISTGTYSGGAAKVGDLVRNN